MLVNDKAWHGTLIDVNSRENIFVDESRKSDIRNYHFCKYLHKLAPKSASF